MTQETTRFDRVAAAWVEKHYPQRVWPDSKVVVGSVTFETDFAAYASAAWARVDVSWRETAPPAFPGTIGPATDRYEHISESAWGEYDLTDLMRELTDMDDPGDTTSQPGETGR